jgi:Tat protein translocase TatB subunit
VEFLGVGYQELILIMGLLLVVVGPERLPTVAYQVGRAVRQMQRYARAVRDEFSDEIDYLEEQYKTVKGEVGSAQQTLRDQQQSWNRELTDATASPQLSVVPPLQIDAPAAVEAIPQTATATEPPKDSSAPSSPMVF